MAVFRQFIVEFGSCVEDSDVSLWKLAPLAWRRARDTLRPRKPSPEAYSQIVRDTLNHRVGMIAADLTKTNPLLRHLSRNS